MSTSNNSKTTEAAPLIAPLDAEQIYAGRPFTGLLLRRVAHLTTPVTISDIAESFGLSGPCILVTDEGEQVCFNIYVAGGPSPAAAPDESIMEQRLAFSMQREGALQTDLASAREELFRVRQEHISQFSALHDAHRRTAEEADERWRVVKADLLDARHGDNEIFNTAIESVQEMLPTVLTWLDNRQPAAQNAAQPAQLPDDTKRPTPEVEMMNWVIQRAVGLIGQPQDQEALDEIAETIKTNREERHIRLELEHAATIVYYLCAASIKQDAKPRDVLAIFLPLLDPFREKLQRYAGWSGRRIASTLFTTAGGDMTSEEGQAVLTFAGKVFELARAGLR